MSRFSELHRDLETIRSIMDAGAPVTPAEIANHGIALAVRDLMNATQALSEMAASRTHEPLVRRESNDIELAYTKLGRMLSRLRQPQLQAAE